MKMCAVIKLVFLFIFVQLNAVESIISGTRIVDADGKPGEMFGSCVAMTEDYVVVSSKYGGNNTGSVCVYNNKRVISHEAKLVPRGYKYVAFGSSLAMNDKYVVVGSRRSGKVYVYPTNRRSWDHEVLTANPSDETKFGILFGTAVGINSYNEIVVGAPRFRSKLDRQTGAAYVFKIRSGRWRQVQRLAPSKSEGMGYHISMTNEHVILSANRASTGLNFMGALYIYKRTRNGLWKANTLLRSPKPTAYGLFGFSTSIHNNQLVVSAPNENVREGNVYVYVPNGRKWKKKTELKVKNHSRRRLFGRSVSIHNEKIVVGTNTNTSHLFELSNGKWAEKDQLVVDDGEQVSTVNIFNNKVIVGCKNYMNGKRAGVAFLFNI